MSLGFASGTLSCFLFLPEVLSSSYTQPETEEDDSGRPTVAGREGLATPWPCPCSRSSSSTMGRSSSCTEQQGTEQSAGSHGGRGGVVPAVEREEKCLRAREDAREEWAARHPLWRAGARVSGEQGAGHAVLLHGGHALDACRSL